MTIKKNAVTGVAAGATATATLLAVVPGDSTTPIASQILELSSYLLIVVCVLVLEKALLTVMGFLSFKILIPIACILLGIYTFKKIRTLKIIAVKCIVFAIILVAIIPVSMKISDLIYDINSTDIEQITLSEEDIAEANIGEEGISNESWLEEGLDKAKQSIDAIGDKAKHALNDLIDTIALFIIAYCVIPIIVVLLIVWLIKFLFGIAIPVKGAANSVTNAITKNSKRVLKIDKSEV